ncbi:PTS mannose/fructose/sorbose/N-acetylgalactosamine transporter subunit IIC [Sporolactobacillus vineae]|uniref:PTS mannose/fructose/sorbose/N-acetylgalactosamine transporter subunit IIC n=1 Tax=Sporolactobacillus vineae TaxID=444463 RepID=UPI0002883F74|nr:PTS sugar transporter subunit IIC [Sporolactobacillus vineae]
MASQVAQITLIQAILIGAYYWFKGCRVGYTVGVTTIFTPLPAALWVGIVLGNIPVAMSVGAALQLMYLGIIAPGGNLPQDSGLAALISCTAAVVLHIPSGAAIALAVPVGLLGAQLLNLERIINSLWVHMADKYAEKGNTGGIYRAGILYPILFKIPFYIIPVATALYFGTGYLAGIVKAIPAPLMNGLTVVGQMLPALGFAIVVSVIGRKYLLPYFALGFFLVAYSNIAILPLAIFGAIIAYLHVLFTKNKNGEGGSSNVSTNS